VKIQKKTLKLLNEIKNKKLFLLKFLNFSQSLRPFAKINEFFYITHKNPFEKALFKISHQKKLFSKLFRRFTSQD
jgi:hypothetical protein